MCLWLCLTENPKNAKLTKLGPIFQHRKEWFSGAIRDSAAVLLSHCASWYVLSHLGLRCLPLQTHSHILGRKTLQNRGREGGLVRVWMNLPGRPPPSLLQTSHWQNWVSLVTTSSGKGKQVRERGSFPPPAGKEAQWAGSCSWLVWPTLWQTW